MPFFSSHEIRFSPNFFLPLSLHGSISTNNGGHEGLAKPAMRAAPDERGVERKERDLLRPPPAAAATAGPWTTVGPIGILWKPDLGSLTGGSPIWWSPRAVRASKGQVREGKSENPHRGRPPAAAATAGSSTTGGFPQPLQPLVPQPLVTSTHLLDDRQGAMETKWAAAGEEAKERLRLRAPGRPLYQAWFCDIYC
jgi:hypothetical protein